MIPSIRHLISERMLDRRREVLLTKLTYMMKKKISSEDICKDEYMEFIRDGRIRKVIVYKEPSLVVEAVRSRNGTIVLRKRFR